MPQAQPLVILPESKFRLREIFEKELAHLNLDLCLTCGLCSSGCPAAGIDDMDPRKLLRLIMLGADEEVLSSPWIWVCTMCNRCKYACPMGIDLMDYKYEVRHPMCLMCLDCADACPEGAIKVAIA
jgi:heterodisulfide reductase subunit C